MNEFNVNYYSLLLLRMTKLAELASMLALAKLALEVYCCCWPCVNEWAAARTVVIVELEEGLYQNAIITPFFLARFSR